MYIYITTGTQSELKLKAIYEATIKIYEQSNIIIEVGSVVGFTMSGEERPYTTSWSVERYCTSSKTNQH